MKDFESEQLDMYDTADVIRQFNNPDDLSVVEDLASGRVFSDREPLPDMTETPTETEENPAFYEEGGFLDRVFGGAAVNAANQVVQSGYELVEGELEKLGTSVGINYVDEYTGSPVPIEYMIQLPPPPQFEDRAEAKGLLEEVLRDIAQFTAVFTATRGMGTNTIGVVSRSAAADAMFDPEQGGLVKMLRDSGFGKETLAFLDASDGDLEQAEDRLRARMGQALEGMGLGFAFDGVMRSLKFIRKHPRFMRKAAKAISGAGIITTSLVLSDEAFGGKLTKFLTPGDRLNIRDSLPNATDVEITEAEDLAGNIKARYPASEGWLELEVGTPTAKSPAVKKKANGSLEVKWLNPSYGFNKPPRNVDYADHVQNVTTRMVDDVNVVVERAKNGDQDAIDIINQANWYRTMRGRLRQEFGGLGDVFADLLGTTSAQTAVQQNWDNAIDILRQFTRGDFDAELAAYQARLQAGEPVDGITLTKLFKDGQFPLITKASGKLYGANSPTSMGALLDMFRQIKAGASPKTPNFTGNLIGFGNDATIDVWAARYLRDAAGLPRIPPPAEKAVAGNHLTGSTLQQPRIGSEFGFGQQVFAEAAKQINESGVIKSVNQELGDLGPDDLQAVVWFLEKEKWTKNGWTNKAGEGGSLDYEASLAGTDQPERVKELRSIINSSKSTPAQKIQAQEELDQLKAPLDRTVIGISRERPNQVPSNVEQAELATDLTAPLKDDESVVAYQANNTYGEFDGQTERSLNVELVTRKDFSPKAATDRLVNLARQYDQDAVFISKVVPQGTPNARPGIEIYFRQREGVDFAQEVTARLREKGIDGFTFVTDARYQDMPGQQISTGEETAGLVGIRFQYIPEFAGDMASLSQNKLDEIVEVYEDVAMNVGGMDGISQANVVYYDTRVFKNTDREGAEWIEGGESYADYLGETTGASPVEGGAREPSAGQGPESADRSGEGG